MNILEHLEKIAMNGPIQQLQQAKALSDQRRYGAKHRKLKELILLNPSDFYIDSRLPGNILGLTHKSGFKIHMRGDALPTELEDRSIPGRVAPAV